MSTQTIADFKARSTRLLTDTQADRIEKQRQQNHIRRQGPAGPAETLRRYDASLHTAGQNREILQRLIGQYDQLSAATRHFEEFTGHPDQRDRIASADHILNEIRTVLSSAQTRVFGGRDILILALQLLCLRASESMGNHDSNVVDAGRVG
ncbi:hypothetical protein IVB18_19925 [Bradyrhizobium sp. 186]|uniref:hypothetical protein n=1 Tax=Bradyrhizobium sp. 186 TaxID=2782654 RepID=UPI002000AA61|nr:hypothetical protein [Bradyrhizobium sp. 186]UPK39300.1 hypothetical protein IVB18_19925 [Bradyrhizobium sp. 186]